MKASLAIAASLLLWFGGRVWGQDLSPRAYVITPIHWNALTFTYTYNSGSLLFDGAVPITGATANIRYSVGYVLSLAEFFRAFREHPCRIALCGR